MWPFHQHIWEKVASQQMKSGMFLPQTGQQVGAGLPITIETWHCKKDPTHIKQLEFKGWLPGGLMKWPFQASHQDAEVSYHYDAPTAANLDDVLEQAELLFHLMSEYQARQAKAADPGGLGFRDPELQMLYNALMPLSWRMQRVSGTVRFIRCSHG